MYARNKQLPPRLGKLLLLIGEFLLYSPPGSQGCLACPDGMTSKPGSGACEETQSSEPVSSGTSPAMSTPEIVLTAIIMGILLAGAIAFGFYVRRRRRLSPREEDVKLVPMGEWTQIEHVEVGDRLGGGQFGEVFRGVWNGTTPVALKRLKSREDLQEFVREASVLQSLNHPNVVRFLGINTTAGGVQYIVMEYLSKGSLDALLASEKESLQNADLLVMAKHAAAGMAYLEERRIVHRDLALRNLLAAPGDGREKYLVKVSDLGLSRPMDRGYYRGPIAEQDQPIPVRWCSPEVLQEGVATAKSDAWSFGVVLWEMFSYGRIPYAGMPVKEVMEKVLAGYQMPAPDNCPPEVYALMVKCWTFNPNGRPSFLALFTELSRLADEASKTVPQRVKPDRASLPPSRTPEGTMYANQL